MIDPFVLGREFFERLRAVDGEIVARAAREPCRHCGGPLHRGDYPRTPRGGLLAVAAEAWERRVQSVLWTRRVPSSRHASVGSFPRPSCLRGSRRHPRQRTRACSSVRRGRRTDDRSTEAHNGAMEPVVARSVPHERAVRRPLCPPRPRTRPPRPSRITARKARRRARPGCREAPRLDGAAHDREQPGRIAMAEGRDVAARTTGLAQRMALPRFFPSA